jgi:ankyrin repeat protein
MPPTCARCGTEPSQPKRCGRCQAVAYCSRACQKAHWSAHKKPCKAAVKAGAKPAEPAAPGPPNASSFDRPSADTDTGLFAKAVRQDNVATVRRLLRRNPALAEGGVGGVSFAAMAAVCGHVSVLRCLVEEGTASVDQRTGESGSTPLCVAAHVGHLAIVKYLVEEGKASVDHETKEGCTPLSLAAIEGHLPIVKYLVEEGKASVDRENKKGATPLCMAALQGHEKVVKYLLRTGRADATRCVEGVSPLHMAVYGKHDKVAKLLARHLRSIGETVDDLHDATGSIVLPTEIKRKLAARHCARCGRTRAPEEGAFKLCSKCKIARYW